MYTPKNLDIPAYSEYLKSCITHQREQFNLEIARVESHKAGFEAGVQEAIQGLQCSNFERDLDPTSYTRGINDLLYELGKELGCGSGDLRDSNLSLDEKAYRMADLIRSMFSDGPEQEP